MDTAKIKAFVTKHKTPILLTVAAVALYFGYRWYKNRQANASGNTASSGATTTGTGSNLNSTNPALVAGSSGPASGLNYYAGSTSVDLSQQASNPTQANGTPTASSPGQPDMGGGPDQTGGAASPAPVASQPATSTQQARTMNPKLNTAPHSTSMAVKRTPAKKPPAKKLDAHQLHLLHVKNKG